MRTSSRGIDHSAPATSIRHTPMVSKGVVHNKPFFSFSSPFLLPRINDWLVHSYCCLGIYKIDLSVSVLLPRIKIGSSNHVASENRLVHPIMLPQKIDRFIQSYVASINCCLRKYGLVCQSKNRYKRRTDLVTRANKFLQEEGEQVPCKEEHVLRARHRHGR